MKQRRPLVILGPLLLLAFALVAAGTASAQTTTGRIQGIVRDAQGALPGATITATNPATGLKRTAVTGVDGGYSLILPPGNYQVTASTPAHEEQRATVTLQVGQVLDNDFTLKPGKMVASAVSVSAEAVPEVELRTTEVATNVTVEQIQNLPQNSRNFLNFAILAPGGRLSHDEFRQEYAYGAQGASNTNVFIDGASYKNDVLQGGVVGQDASRGNPFPQNAVQEYRVITQNYKAEYQKASSAIISAVTKSGTNEFHGDAIVYYQNKSLVAQDYFAEQRGDPKGDFTRWQPGLSFGGPLAKDKLFFFASYEGNYQNRANYVYLGSQAGWPSSFREQFNSYTGTYTSPYRGSLFFGKLSYLPGEGSTLDFSGNYRKETDIRSFGGQTSYEAAENVKQDIYTILGKYTLLKSSFLNEATGSFQQYKWNPTVVETETIGQDYQGLMRIGGRDTTQNFTQDRFAIRDDFSLLNVRWMGEHAIKVGASYDHLNYHVVKLQNGNPVFRYRWDLFMTTPGDMPFEAAYGTGDPDISTTNTQWGVYAQDEWRVTPQLTLNLGLRWDIETDMLNNSYVTPAVITDNFTSVYPANYFSDGSNRTSYAKALQPRLGASYDLSGKGKTVLFAGYGRYYDRTLYNDILDEKFRLQYQVRTFYFSKDGLPRDGRETIKWDPSYLSKAGLDTLIAKGIAPAPEVFLLDNNTVPPSADQFSGGIRHNFGSFSAAASYLGSRGRDQMTWRCGSQNPNGTCHWGGYVPGFGTNLLSAGKDSSYDAFALQLDKPFTVSSRWGASLTYTYGKAKANGGDLFSLDYPNPEAYGMHRTPSDQEHTIVASAMVLLPLGFRASTLMSFGSGVPFTIFDASAGWDNFKVRIGAGDPIKWNQSIDLRLQKDFVFGDNMRLGLVAEAFNIFDYVNYDYGNDWETGFIPPAGDPPNQNFGKAFKAYNPQRFQFGVTFSF